MRAFRFRAQAALDLRISQEEKALLALAQAQTSAERARMRTEEAIGGVSTANQQLDTAQHDGANGGVIGWHRSWIAKQHQEVEARKREAAVSAVAVDRATASVQETHRKRRTLERLRDRSRRNYDQDLGRQDAREMNQLAGLRFVAQAADQGESNNGDRSNDSPGRHTRGDDDLD